jgi:hypothetical protein
MPSSSIKDEKVYKALRKEGASKEKAARIANAAAAQGRSKIAKKGGKAGDYEDQTKEQLLKQAKKIGIKGRSKMKKKELIKALRNH